MSISSHNYMSMIEALDGLKARGFTEDYIIREGEMFVKDKKYNPQDLLITEVYRFEGKSSPQDHSVVYAIESTDGVKGTIVDGYGVYADDAKSDFLEKVPIRELE